MPDDATEPTPAVMDDAARAALGEGLSALGLSPTAAQIDLLAAHWALVAGLNRDINLTAIREPGDAVVRHYLDSAAAWRFIPDTKGIIADFGTGGGFPGIPLAILLPDAPRVALVESKEKKARILHDMVRTLGLQKHVEVWNQDARRGHPSVYRGVVRALGPMTVIGEIAHRRLVAGGTLLAFKGRRATIDAELSALAETRYHAGLTITIEPVTVPGLPEERHIVRVVRETKSKT